MTIFQITRGTKCPLKEQEAGRGNHEMYEERLCCLLCTSEQRTKETGVKQNLTNCGHLYCKL
jgi:hypothetical protein